MKGSRYEWERGGRVGSVFRGWMLRLAASVILLVGGFVAIVLYLAFWASSFVWYQNLAVVLSILLIVPACVVLVWISWGLAVRRRIEGRPWGWDREDHP